MGRIAMKLDFGTGALAVIERGGKEYLSLRNMCMFIGADYETQLKAEREGIFAERLRTGNGGHVLFPLDGFPFWLMNLDTEQIAPEHRDGHRAWVQSIVDSGILTPVAKKHFPELLE